MDLDLFTPHDAKEQGNRFFKSGQLENAIRAYSTCVDLFKKERSVEALLQADNREILLAVYLNRALAFTKLGKFRNAISDCTEALRIDQKNVKALFRRAQAYISQKDYSSSLKDLETVLEYEPGHPQAIVLKVEAAEKDKEAKKKQKEVQEKEAAEAENERKGSGKENIQDISQLAMMLQCNPTMQAEPVKQPSPVAVTSASKPKITIEEIVQSEKDKNDGEFTVTKEIAERWKTAKGLQGPPQPAGAKEHVPLMSYDLDFSNVATNVQIETHDMPATAADACIGIMKQKYGQDDDDIDADWQDLDGNCERGSAGKYKRKGIGNLVMKLQENQSDEQGSGADGGAGGKQGKPMTASQRYRSKIQLRKDKLSEEAEQTWACLEKEEVQTTLHVSDRLSQKREQERSGLQKRRAQIKNNKWKRGGGDLNLDDAANDSDSDSSDGFGYSSDDEFSSKKSKKSSKNRSGEGGGCWLDNFTPDDACDSGSESDEEGEVEGGWQKVVSPTKKAAGSRHSNSFSRDSDDDKDGRGKHDSEWRELLKEEEQAREAVARRKSQKAKMEEEGLARRQGKLKARDQAMGVGPRHCLVAVPDLAAFVGGKAKAGAKAKASRASGGEVVEVDDENPLLYGNAKGAKGKGKKAKAQVEEDPMLVTHLATADGYGEVSNKDKKGKKDKKNKKDKKDKKSKKDKTKVKVPATAFALEKVWARQFRREPALFHDMLFSGAMDAAVIKSVFSSLNDPTIVSEAILGMDKYLGRKESDSVTCLATTVTPSTVVPNSLALLQALTRSGRFMTTIMMLADSDKLALERVFHQLESRLSASSGDSGDMDLQALKAKYTK